MFLSTICLMSNPTLCAIQVWWSNKESGHTRAQCYKTISMSRGSMWLSLTFHKCHTYNYGSILMHDLKHVKSLQLDTFEPATWYLVGSFHLNGENLSLKTHWALQIIMSKSSCKFIELVLHQKIFHSKGLWRPVDPYYKHTPMCLISQEVRYDFN